MASISGGGVLDAIERFRLKRVSWLVNELRAKKSKDCTMVDYLEGKVAIWERLQSLQHPISEEELKYQILKGLPDRYVAMPLEMMECPLPHLTTKLMGLEDLEDDGMNQDDGVSRPTNIPSSSSSSSSSSSRHRRLRRPRRPLRKRRAHRKSVRGDVHLLMTLVLSLLFSAGLKPTDEFFQPLFQHQKCNCVGSGANRQCGCMPIAFIVWQGIIFAGLSIAAVSIVRLMGTHHPYGWMWILIVVITFMWNGVVYTPYHYRLRIFVMFVVIMFVVDIIMLISYVWNWGVICLYSMMGCSLIRLPIKSASQFLGLGILHVWQGTKTALWQLAQACKIFVSTVKNAIFGAPQILCKNKNHKFDESMEEPYQQLEDLDVEEVVANIIAFE